MSYQPIPRFATSANCSRAQYRKVWLFENIERKRAHGRNWHRANPSWNNIRNAMPYNDDWGYGIMEQKSPLELLMEKEEALLAA